MKSISGFCLLLANVAATIFGLVVLTFFIGRLLPTDPVVSILGDAATKEAYEALYKQMGLDQPIYVQFMTYLRNVAQFDFGDSVATGNRVLDDVMRAFPATMELATFAIVIGATLGILLGVLAAMYRNSWIDNTARIIGLLGYATPTFWLGLMGLILFYATLDWTGGPGRISVAYEYIYQPVTGFLLLDAVLAGDMELFADGFSHIVLPGSILATSAMAFISRMTRSFVAEQLAQEYITTARVKGLSWSRTVWFHAVPNAGVQILTTVALAYAFLLEGAVLTETVFSWPGFGRYMTNALLAGDMNAVLGCTIVVGLVFVTINMICDGLYRVLDPRTK